MADFTALKTAIQNAIKQNGNEEITGTILQEIMLAVVSTLGDSAINDLVTALSNEVTNRQNADGTLQSNINAEQSARQLGDSTLQSGINNERDLRIAADNALGTRIDNEATARGNADTALQNAINAINTKLAEGYVYVGIATTSTNPSTPSGKVFYIAVAAGTYTNFGNIAVTQGINILKYNGSAWSLDVIASIDDAPTPSSNNLVKSSGVFNGIMTNGSAFDISAHFASDGTLATYANLSAALTALNTLSAAYKKGGMSIKFVQSSDNKYVQWRLMSDTWSIVVDNWQGVDDELYGDSKNLVKNKTIYDNVYKIYKEAYKVGSLVSNPTTINAIVTSIENGSISSIGGNYRLRYVPVTKDTLYYCVVTDGTSTKDRAVLFFENEPAVGVSFKTMLYKNDGNIEGDMFKAPKDGYIATYYYATGDGYIYNTLTPLQANSECVSINKQNFTEEQKHQAVANIGLDTVAIISDVYNETCFPSSLSSIKAIINNIEDGTITSIGGNYTIKYVQVQKGDIYKTIVTDVNSSTRERALLFFEQEPAANVSFKTVEHSSANNIERYYRVEKNGYLGVYHYATGDGSLKLCSKEEPINYFKGEKLQDGYYNSSTIEGKKLYISTGNFRTIYHHVSAGDIVIVTAVTTRDKGGIWWSDVEPLANPTEPVYKLYGSTGEKGKVIHILEDGYIMAHYYATESGSICQALTADEYTDSQIANIERPYPSYYTTYMDNKLKAFYDSNKVNSKQSDSFVFITDIHIGRNRMQSPKLIEGIMMRSVITKVFFGGDIPYVNVATRKVLYDYWQQFQEFYNRINPLGTLFNIRGNHEWNNYIEKEGGWINLPKSEVYATLMGKYNPNLLIHQNDAVDYPCYYYVDNEHPKIRYIILDGSSNSAVTEDSYAQGTWLTNVLNSTPQGYDVIVFSHIALTDAVWTEPIADYMEILKRANNREGDFVNCQCTVKVVFAGHSHYDFQNWDGGILNIVTNCDYYGNAAYYPENDVPSEDVRYGYKDTVLEQSFDICNIDFGGNLIDLIKIGFGPSRRIHLDSTSINTGGTTSLTKTISGSVTWYSYNTDSAFSTTSLVNDVVSVDENTGVITALKAGSAVVMAKNENNDREFWKIDVN